MSTSVRPRGPVLLATFVLGVVTSACSGSREIPGNELPKTEVDAVLGQVDRDLEITRHRAAVALIPATLDEYPAARRVLARTHARLDADGYVEVGHERATGIRSVLVTPPGIGERGARLYVVELAVTLNAVGLELARAGVIVCRDVTGTESTMHAGDNPTSAIFYTSYDPRVPLPRGPNAGPPVIRPDCPRLAAAAPVATESGVTHLPERARHGSVRTSGCGPWLASRRRA